MRRVQIEMKWAFIFTLAVLAWMLLEKLTGLHDRYIDHHMYLTNLFAIPAIVLMVLALKNKKKAFYGGNMSYRAGLLSGALLSLFIALLSPGAQWLTTYVISPEYFPNVIERSVALGYYDSTEAAAAHFNYANYAKMGAVSSFLMGVLTTAIAMIFLRSKKRLQNS